MFRTWFVIAALTALGVPPIPAQRPSSRQATRNSSAPANPLSDPSGMYSFLKEGEFVQLNIEDGKISGYISRFGDSDSDKGQFIDQFFSKASYESGNLSFNTKVVHGVWYEFKGTLSVAPDKQPGKEGYRIIRGVLTQHVSDAKGADSAGQRQVEFKSFPDDIGRP